jgi:hypothetical protein
MGLLSFIKAAIVAPTEECIYAPSRIETGVTEMDMKEFMERYADSARGIQVSRESDGKSSPSNETAYGFGLDCWYIEATDDEIAHYTDEENAAYDGADFSVDNPSI